MASSPDPARPERARRIRVGGTVQGVGFRPFVTRTARELRVRGWVRNVRDGVEIHAEGSDAALDGLVAALRASPPPAAEIATLHERAVEADGHDDFRIRSSDEGREPSVRVPPDLPPCDRCLTELFDPADPRHGYPYINCSDCGPRFSIVLGLPYDRARTTMRGWSLCPACAAQFADVADRRFHAQPLACPRCGPQHVLRASGASVRGDAAVVRECVRRLLGGDVLAIKGVGGYHLACDARNPEAVGRLRRRKYRKEKPFAIMVPTVEVARSVVALSSGAERLLTSRARPIVLAPSRWVLADVAPDNRDLGVMLPYTPLHHLLFAAGAPRVLVMTSANRSSEPIACGDEEAAKRLGGIADAFVVGERPIARRVEDSVVRDGYLGPVVVRRSRGLAPGVAARLPLERPVLAVGADLKSAVTLVVDGDAIVGPHLGDLDHLEARAAFDEAVADLLSMYRLRWSDVTVVHDAHPGYHSTVHARALPARTHIAVQHHRAHVASVLAERGALERRVLGVALDGTGYGDDGSIWGGELFAGSVLDGFERVAHLRPAVLPGGDAAARFPVQAAAGYLAEIDEAGDLHEAPFGFPPRYAQARALLDRRVRVFPTTSTGRLFDTAAALVGFVREATFEGQAAVWLEHLGRGATDADRYPVDVDEGQIDYRPLLRAMIERRRAGDEPSRIARGFHLGLAAGLAAAAERLCEQRSLRTVVLSGGVVQNELLTEALASSLRAQGLDVWTNVEVPPNDGGISLGQAALAVPALR